jgi:hypothetical protein
MAAVDWRPDVPAKKIRIAEKGNTCSRVSSKGPEVAVGRFPDFNFSINVAAELKRNRALSSDADRFAFFYSY